MNISDDAESTFTVSVTRLRQNFSQYLYLVQKGGEVGVTLRGKVIAYLLPATDRREEAKTRLAQLRKTARVGDVKASVGGAWKSISCTLRRPGDEGGAGAESRLVAGPSRA